jgi:hypothetical protein
MRYVSLPRLKLIAGLALFLLALWLRTDGLSHDLHLDRVYHPDTPKQIRAVERFLDGDYYTYIGGRDYEGYPLFNSHLVEYLIRGYLIAANALTQHVGLTEPVTAPDYFTMFWITRALNATLSALAVVIVFLIGWRWLAPAAGALAGLLLAVSPVDVIACHYANGDTAAAFFATLGLYLAITLRDRPTYPRYFFAALTAAAAFSSKYHGGIALGTVGLAHVFYFGHQRKLFTRASMARVLFLLFSFVVGLFLTSPALIVHTEAAFDDILQFLEYTASFGMTEEMRAMSLGERFLMGMSINMPALQDVVGWIPILAAAAALAVGFFKTTIWLMASVPLVYILAALATKPLTHAVYHTMATPGIMLLTSYTLNRLQAGHRFVWPRRLASMLLAGIAFAYLAGYAMNELFFFRHNDTRLLSEYWARDNVPASFSMSTSPYTFVPQGWFEKESDLDQTEPAGAAYVFSGRTGVRPPAGAIPMHTFRLETDEKLVVFRNWPQYMFAAKTTLLTHMAPRPGFQPLAAPHPINLIDIDAPWWIRHPLTWSLTESDTRKGALTSTNVITQAAWLIRAAEEPTDLTLNLGGQRQRIRLDGDQVIIQPIDTPRAARASRTDRFFCEWKLSVHFGAARITLLTSPRDLAWAHFHTGAFSACLQNLNAIPEADLTRGDQLIRRISQLTQAIPPQTPDREQQRETEGNDITLLADYGIAASYLAELPGQDIDLSQCIAATITNQVTGEALFHELRLPPQQLEPGLYTLQMHVNGALPVLELSVYDAQDRMLESRYVDTNAPMTNPLEIDFAVAEDDGALALRLRFPASIRRIPLAGLTIRPDVEATLNRWRQLQTFLQGDDAAIEMAERFWYAPLMAAADHRAEAGRLTEARRLYTAAIQAAPYRLRALEGLQAITDGALTLRGELGTQIQHAHDRYAAARTVHPVWARFNTGIELTGYQLSTNRVRAGETFGFITHWRPDHLNRNVRRHAAWLHAVPEGESHAAFQGDQPLTRLTKTARADEDHMIPALIQIQIPPETSPGQYMLKTGLWIPSQRKRTKIEQADGQHEKRSVTLTEIEVY